MVKIVTDSTADLPLSCYEEHGIEVVPLYISFGDDTYKENVDLSNEEFYRKLSEFEPQGIPTTSQPTPQDFVEAYGRMEEEQIISLHISSKLSGTCQSATVARTMVSDKDITVVDSELVSVGLGMLVLAAARAARKGMEKAEILERIDVLRRETKVYFTVETLAYLEKGGRIGKAQALLGTILHVVPILSFKEGVIVPVEKIRGSKRVLPRYKELVGRLSADREAIDVILIHAQCEARIGELERMLREEFNCREIVVSSVGGVVGSHAGPGTWGLAVRGVQLADASRG